VQAIRPKGLLDIPELREPPRDGFDIRPKKLEHWIVELPKGDTGECARRLYYALKEINRYQISHRDRWRTLEIFCPLVESMTANLERLFSNQQLPLAEKNQKIAELCIELNSELALGYKILLDQIWTKKLSLLNVKFAIGIIYRAMHYLYRVLINAFEVYADPPSHTWQHIHQLYLYAEENRLTAAIPRDIASTSSMQRTTIEHLYIQIVLVGLISPFRLRQHDTKKIVTALKQWCNDCRVLPADQFSETLGHVLLKQNSDQAPGYYFPDHSINHVYTRTLDSSALVEHITNLVVNESSRVDQNTHIFDLPADVIKLLILTWSGKSHRLFSRTSKENELAVSVGINATHFMINRMQQLFPSIIENSPYAALLKVMSTEEFQKYTDLHTKEEIKFDSESHFEAAPVFGISNFNNAVADIWDDDYSSKTIGRSYNLQIWQQSKDKTVNKDSQVFHAVQFDNINESANGYCLFSDLRHESSPTKVQVGEVIGIRNDKVKKKQDAVDFGIIRRLKSTDKGVELGIQKLSPQADAVAICAYHTRNFQKPKYQRALLLPEIKPMHKPYTLVMNKHFKIGDELLMIKLGFKSRISLTKIIETTAEFNQFEFEVKKILGLEADQPAAQAESGNKFDTVWTLI